MRHKKKFAEKPIGYDNSAPTAWLTIFVLVLCVLSFANTALAHVYAVEVDNRPMHAENERQAAQEALREADRQAYLAELRHCESSGDHMAAGDGGDSNGEYQVQEETLEDWLGRKVSTSEYYAIVRDFDRIHPLVYDAYFERGEDWRWVICTKKVNAIRTWTL